MTAVAAQLDELRTAVGEVDALAALALESFDRADWSGADPQLVERTAYVIGIIARSAASAASKLDGFHAAVGRHAARARGRALGLQRRHSQRRVGSGSGRRLRAGTIDGMMSSGRCGSRTPPVVPAPGLQDVKPLQRSERRNTFQTQRPHL
jgi:hypothetical protein